MTTVTTHNPVRSDLASTEAGRDGPHHPHLPPLGRRRHRRRAPGRGHHRHQLGGRLHLRGPVQPRLGRRRRRGAQRQGRPPVRLPLDHRARRRAHGRVRRRPVPPAPGQRHRQPGPGRRARRPRRHRGRLGARLRARHRVHDGGRPERLGRRRRLGRDLRPLDRHHPVALDAGRSGRPRGLRRCPVAGRSPLARHRRARARRADRAPGRLAAGVHVRPHRRAVAPGHGSRLHPGRQVRTDTAR